MPDVEASWQGLTGSPASFVEYHQRVQDRIAANREGRRTAVAATQKEVLETPEDLLSAKPSPVPPRSPGFERLAALMEGRWAEEYGVEHGMWHGPPVPKEMVAEMMARMEGTMPGWGHWSGFGVG